MFKRELAYLQF